VRDLLSSHIAKSRLAKPRNELSLYIYIYIYISVFSAPGNSSAMTSCLRISNSNPLVLAGIEVPVGEIPKRLGVNRISGFGV
jgi:hypothetical protein